MGVYLGSGLLNERIGAMMLLKGLYYLPHFMLLGEIDILPDVLGLIKKIFCEPCVTHLFVNESYRPFRQINKSEGN